MAEFLIREEGEVKKIRSTEQITSIGTHPSNEIILAPHPQILKEHCKIVETAQGFILLPTVSSATGSINGKPLQKHRLKTGDTLQIGSTTIQFFPTTIPFPPTEEEPPPEEEPPAQESWEFCLSDKERMKRVYLAGGIFGLIFLILLILMFSRFGPSQPTQSSSPSSIAFQESPTTPAKATYQEALKKAKLKKEALLLISQLGDSNPQTRKDTTQKLKKFLLAHREIVAGLLEKTSTTHPDPTVRWRARWVLETVHSSSAKDPLEKISPGEK